MRKSFLILSIALLAGSVVLPNSSQAARTHFLEQDEGETPTGFHLRPSFIGAALPKQFSSFDFEGRLILEKGFNRYQLNIQGAEISYGGYNTSAAPDFMFTRLDPDTFDFHWCLTGLVRFDPATNQYIEGITASFAATITRLPDAPTPDAPTPSYRWPAFL